MSKENDIVTIRIPLELRKQLAKAAARESRSVPGMAAHFLAVGVSHLEQRSGLGGIFPAQGVSHPNGPHDGEAGQARPETGSGSGRSAHGIIANTSLSFAKGVSHPSVSANPQAREDNPAPNPDTP